MSNARKAPGAKPETTEFTNLERALALIADAQLPGRTISLCLRADLVAELDELEADLRTMRPSDRLTGNAEARAVAEKIEALRQRMKDSTVRFRLQSLPPREFQKFVAEHGPRDGNAEDKAAGINTETYFFDLVQRCLIGPALDPDQLGQLVLKLSLSQWRELTQAAVDLNIEKISIPFSQAASMLLRPSPEK